MFEVNDIPPIDSWALQDLIAENVQHEEFLFFRINHGDDLDWILGEADDYESLPMLLHDEKHPDDVANDPHEYTHPADMLRYFVAGRPIAASEPKEFNELTTEEEMGNVFSY